MVAPSTSAVPKFLTAPPPKVRGFLLYGSDALQIAARGQALVARLAAGMTPPPEVIRLHQDDLTAAPDKIEIELGMSPLFGGRKILQLLALPAKAQAVLLSALAHLGEGTVLIAHGVDLKRSHKLVAVFEEAAHLAAVACHGEDEASLAALIRQEMATHGFSIEPEAARLVAARCDYSFLIARGECEKLMTLAGEPRLITAAEVEQTLTDQQTAQSYEIVDAALGGDEKETLIRFERLMAVDQEVTPVLLALASGVRRLHELSAEIEAGTPALQAVKALRPPVFFKQQDALLRQARLWTATRLESVGHQLNPVLRQSRLRPQLAQSITLDFLLQVARSARAPAAIGKDGRSRS